jgi:hypothetical protein
MVDRYARYEELRERGLAARLNGETAFGDALLELARLVLLSEEKEAVYALRHLPSKERRD